MSSTFNFLMSIFGAALFSLYLVFDIDMVMHHHSGECAETRVELRSPRRLLCDHFRRGLRDRLCHDLFGCYQLVPQYLAIDQRSKLNE